MPPVREALMAVKGVTRADVTFEGHEAVVTYDPSQATVDDLIRAVDSIEGPIRFRARRKTSP